MKKINLVAASIALIVAAGFLYLVLTPPSYFNALPSAIYESFFMEVTSSGEVISRIEEATFIKIFDVVFAVLIFWGVYRITKTLLWP